MHQAKGFQEQGVSMSVSFDPSPSSPLGLMVKKAAPSSGGQATSGADALWNSQAMAGFGYGAETGSRLDSEIGYGLPVGPPVRRHAAGWVPNVRVWAELSARL